MARIEIAKWNIRDCVVIDGAWPTNKTGLANGVRLRLRIYKSTDRPSFLEPVFCIFQDNKLYYSRHRQFGNHFYEADDAVCAVNIDDVVHGLRERHKWCGEWHNIPRYFNSSSTTIIVAASLALYSNDLSNPNTDVDMYCGVKYVGWEANEETDGWVACNFVDGKMVYRDRCKTHQKGSELQAKNVREVTKSLCEQAANWGNDG